MIDKKLGASDGYKTLLFVCTGNSCRSQMAEVIANAYASENGIQVRAYSAGSRPATAVQQQTITVLHEHGYSTTGLHPKGTTAFASVHFDMVITLCDAAAANLACMPEHTILTHTPFPDPYDAVGTADQVVEQYRHVRDMIETWMTKWFVELGKM